MRSVYARACGGCVRSISLVAVVPLLLLAQSTSVTVPPATAPTSAGPNQNSNKKVTPGQPDPDAVTPQNSTSNGNATPATVPQGNQAPGAPQNANPQSQTPMEFESHGMEYEALTREGITVMFATLPPRIKDYNIIQITVTNGSLVSWTVKPSDFTFVRQDGTVLQASDADAVVESLLEKASRADVIKLQLMYEDTIYALSNFRSTNGYEKRREAAMAQFVKPELKAAVAASAITFVPTKLKPGDSTDGAIFFENKSPEGKKDKTLGPGRMVAHCCGETFEFIIYPETRPR